MIETAHDEGREVNVWTIRDWQDAARAIDANADGIISDAPGYISFAKRRTSEGPEVVGDAVSGPTDPDDDGLYEDIDGDGEVTDADGELLFERFEESAVQDNPESYDFNGNGRLDSDDIVEWRKGRDN